MKTGAPVIIGSAAKVVGTAAGTATAGLLISTGVLAPPAPVVGSAVCGLWCYSSNRCRWIDGVRLCL